MRQLLVGLAGLGLAALLGFGPLRAGEPAVKKEGETCGDFGTSVNFVETPKDAATQAKKEGKLVFVLHVSGNFEDPRFT